MTINKIHLILGISLGLSLILLGKIGCSMSKLSDTNDQLNKELMQANLDIGRAHTEFSNAEKYIGELEKEIQKEISIRDATLNSYGELKLSYFKLIKNRKIKSKIIFKNRIINSTDALKNGSFYQAIEGNFLKEITKFDGFYNDFRLRINSTLDLENGVNWTFNYELNLKLYVQLAETYLPSGGVNHYVSVYEVDDNGNKIGKLKVTGYEVKINRPNDSRWYWWSPKLDVGGILGVKINPPDLLFGGSFGFSPFGYGKTINDLQWRFLRISFDLIDKMPSVGITPVLYNIATFIPLLSNLWIGVHFSYNLLGTFSLSLFIGACL